MEFLWEIFLCAIHFVHTFKIDHILGCVHQHDSSDHQSSKFQIHSPIYTTNL